MGVIVGCGSSAAAAAAVHDAGVEKDEAVGREGASGEEAALGVGGVGGGGDGLDLDKGAGAGGAYGWDGGCWWRGAEGC